MIVSCASGVRSIDATAHDADRFADELSDAREDDISLTTDGGHAGLFERCDTDLDCIRGAGTARCDLRYPGGLSTQAATSFTASESAPST